MQTPRDNGILERFDHALAGPKLKQIPEAIYAEPCFQSVPTFRHLAHSYTLSAGDFGSLETWQKQHLRGI